MRAGFPLPELVIQRMRVLFALTLFACLLLVLLRAGPSTFPAPQPGTDAGPSAERSYGQLPIAFAPGTRGEGADFTASTAGGSIYLSSRGAAISSSSGGAPVTIAPVGATAVEPQAAGRLPGVVNDLRGDDPSKWRREVPTFARVRYDDVYPGIAMDWHGTSGTLEYDFRLAPGADPGRIAVGYAGAPLHLTGGGALVVGRGEHAVRQAPPVAFQRIGGERVPVDASFELQGRRVGFELGAYDSDRPLVIDPLVLTYSTLLGSGSDYDTVNDVAIDSSGNAYLTGYTGTYSGPDPAPAFPVTTGAYDTTRGGQFDAFVTKLNASGTAAVYSTLLGGSDQDVAEGIEVDASGNAYVTGSSLSSANSGGTSYPVTGGAFETDTHGGWRDVFVTKLNAAGSGLVYSSYFGGGKGDEQARAIAVDSTGAAWITGFTNSYFDAGTAGKTAYPAAGGGSGDPGDNFSADMIVTKLNPAGSALAFSTYLGGNNQDEAFDIDVDSSDRAFVTGFTTSATTQMPLLNQYEGKTTGSTPSNADAYLARFSSTGTLQYASAIGGNAGDYAYGIAADNSGGAYITGASTDGPPGFDLKNEYEGYNGNCCFHQDAFVAKFDTGATGAESLVYSTLLGGGGTEAGQSIEVDSTGAAYVGGTTSSGVPASPLYDKNAYEFDVTTDRLAQNTGGSAFVTKFAPAGNTLAWSTTIPNGSSSSVHTIYGLAVDEAHSAVYFGGTSTGNAASGYPTTPGAFQTTVPGGLWDGFAGKLTFSTGPVDTTPPDTTITSGPAQGGTTTSRQPAIGFSSTEAGSSFQCRYDGAAFSACTSPYTPPAQLGLGSHTFEVRAIDASNNVDPSPASRTFTVTSPTPPPDTTPPQTTISKAPPATIKSKKLPVDVSFSFASSEPGSTFTCRIDGGAAQPCSSPKTYGLGKGSHTFTVSAKDKAGNADATPATAKVTVKKKKKKKKKGGKKR